ncbi:MAG: hypothetical protein J1E83_09510 [Lachnospiraceae bacterium]|nr:hypothetical protein [Lachnospiraceae bacterium]
MYVEIDRQYIIARADENYLSLRIYEYNDSRLANHPNAFENGITINIQTGEVMHIKDIIGDEWTLEDYDTYSDFYLTDDSFGLITSIGTEYTCIEASLEELNKIHPLQILQ